MGCLSIGSLLRTLSCPSTNLTCKFSFSIIGWIIGWLTYLLAGRGTSLLFTKLSTWAGLKMGSRLCLTSPPSTTFNYSLILLTLGSIIVW